MTPPSDLLHVAGVGVGGMGRSNMASLASERIVAVCDIDWNHVGAAFGRLDADIRRAEQRRAQAATAEDRQRAADQIARLRRLKDEHWPKAARYTDFRAMLDKQKDIDAVVVATPDHTHALVALTAMSLGKHVYVQKPLTWSVDEARRLSRMAAETRLATQLGNQGHSFDDARLGVEYVRSGAIGEVREVHVWTNRPLAYWPQGIPRPRAMTSPTGDAKWSMATEFQPLYHPHHWRGWVDFGVGAIGDMGAHLVGSGLVAAWGARRHRRRSGMD